MKPAIRHPFFSAVLIAGSSCVISHAETTLLTDHFDTVSSFTASPNADQGGLLAPATYTVERPWGGTAYARRGAGVLELNYNGTSSGDGARAFTNADYVTVANAYNSPVRFSFKYNSTNTSEWIGFVVGTSSAWMDGGGDTTEFSALFQSNGAAQRWVNGANAALAAINPTDTITLELRNTAGTGSAFNGTGSVAQLWSGTTSLGIFTLDQLSAANGKFAFASYDGSAGGGPSVDDFKIAATVDSVPNRWSGAVDGNWDETTANFTGGSFAAIKANGATAALFGDVNGTLGVVTNSSLTIASAGVEIADVIFDNNNVAYTLASGGTSGIKGASKMAKTGSGTLTIGNINTYTGTTTINGGTLVLSGGNNRLPVTTALTLTSPGVLRLDGNNQEVAGLSSNGRVVNGSTTLGTFTVNNATAETFSGTLGGSGTDDNNLALVKSGLGSLSLTAASSHTGGTTVHSGTLSLNHEPIGIANTAIGAMDSDNTVTINNGGILTSDGLRNNWLSSTQVFSGGGNAISLVINSGGMLKGANNRITGLGNVTLNGGTIEVSSGLNAFGWFASYNLGGDITVSGSTPSFITTAASANGSANLQMSNGSNGGGGTRFLTVGDVTNSAAADLIISARLSSGTLVKDGPGTVEIDAGETGTGFPVSWEIDAGSLVVADGATFEFRVTDGTSNRVLNTGTGSAAFNGTLNINTAAVTSTTGMIWSLIDVAGLGAVFGPNFAVSGFDDSNNDGVWTKTDTLGAWSFSEATGELTLDVGNDYDAWKSDNNVTGGPAADDDNDGVSNFEEYAFGLNPQSGSSVNSITVPLDKTAKAFSYTRRDKSLADLTYSVWFSTNLTDWTEDIGAVEGPTTLNGEVETVPVTLSTLPGDPLPAKLFIQVRAQ